MELTFLELLLRLGSAALIGAILGVDREVHRKPAGLRTHALVALGAATLTVAGIAVSRFTPGSDDAVSRVIQGVVAGIGFLGAGAILKGDEPGGIRGLTTAASIWVVAAIGIACGAGLWVTALLSVGLAVLILIGGAPLERAIRRIVRSPGEAGGER
jgi:putative Mg2+ transporter-C (MgtC) family protein